MSNTKITQGEWYLDGYQIKSTVCCLELAKVTVFNEGKANATLMASSPLLYKALEEISLMVSHEPMDISFKAEIHSLISEALASPRGE